MNGGQIGCRHFAATAKQKGATFSRNPLFYLVELAGVEPASEIPTSSYIAWKNKAFPDKSMCCLTLINSA
ncbi:hypothetical protein ECA91_23435 [Salmonella enterica subsp. enterica serovar Mbandaka]|nr:hypothetical protein [Salmonella enterica subsp. enterica serovar Mbandaka]EBW3229399.1 hypothetical protein [Salmonella enterica subsp. enterica serovar Mbandaka]EBZ5317715.1 hypothetical protein [Salmonella enterica subsp. enterica serovar Mbandaka]EBZ6777464.1 hypothetical protein [Salmonella enterica subsp. enterica serovar Mbandaka]MLP55160.1 hypothetical protein [Salmonella enterica subsp. enterica serovar Mbandaka]